MSRLGDVLSMVDVVAPLHVQRISIVQQLRELCLQVDSRVLFPSQIEQQCWDFFTKLDHCLLVEARVERQHLPPDINPLLRRALLKLEQQNLGDPSNVLIMRTILTYSQIRQLILGSYSQMLAASVQNLCKILSQSWMFSLRLHILALSCALDASFHQSKYPRNVYHFVQNALVLCPTANGLHEISELVDDSLLLHSRLLFSVVASLETTLPSKDLTKSALPHHIANTCSILENIHFEKVSEFTKQWIELAAEQVLEKSLKHSMHPKKHDQKSFVRQVLKDVLDSIHHNICIAASLARRDKSAWYGRAARCENY